MNLKNASSGYGLPSIVLHWLMLVLLIAVYASMEFKSIFPKRSPERELMAVWHYMLGLSVFFLVWLRLLLRFAGTEPSIVPPSPAWQAGLARAMHWLLYLLMAVLPMLGWLTLDARGTPVPFFGVALPALIGRSDALAGQLKEVHEFLATAGYVLVALHAVAALFHHYILRDNTLRLMLPVRRSGAGAPSVRQDAA